MIGGVVTDVTGEVTTVGVAPAWIAGVLLGALAIGIVWMGLALGAVYRKVGARPALAWIPVVRYAVLAHLTQSSVVGTVVARAIAALGYLTWLVCAFLISNATVGLVGLGVAAVAAAVAWAMWIVQTHRFGLDHSLPGALPVVAAIAPAVWAAIVGWGGGLVPVASASARPVARDDAGDAAPSWADEAPRGAGAAGDAAGESEPEAQAPQAIWGASPASVLWAHAPQEPANVDDMYPVEPFTGTDGYPRLKDAEAAPEPEAVPEPAPQPEPGPEPEAVPASEADRPARVSPFASLAPEVLDRSAEERAWNAAAAETGAVPEVQASPEAPVAADAPDPETPPAFLAVAAELPDALDVPAEPDTEPVPQQQAAPEPEPEPEPEPAVDVPPPAAPVYVEPTPTLPISPYLRGGAAAPPEAPSAVPSFAMPVAPVPAPPTAPAPDVEPGFEPDPEPTLSPEPAAEPSAPAAPIILPPPPVAAAPAEPVAHEPVAPAPHTADDHPDDRTQVSARQREAWELVTSEGGVYGFDAEAVLVGRSGGLPPIDGTRRLDLVDSTRTVSKTHARLELTRGTWWVEDLGSTNGTYLVDATGHETQVPDGVPTPVTGRLILGDVEVDIRRRGGA
ncbi:FHA domain-containing protein [Demequina iriomotensis]|uniref:FHA domain-containing protein n=1 Tax=Demequina iriomotensis TaxID=1536641 RepID=UPI00078657B2|nr:FHA domain-containing protein [Demequina iriomotensis]